METETFNKLLQQNEGINLEFKQEVNLDDTYVKADFLRHFLALANSANNQAYLIVGIEDEARRIVGLKDEHVFSEERVQQVVRQYCTSPINFSFEIISIQSLSVAVITIPKSETKPHWLIKDIEGRYSNNKVWKIPKERIFIRRGSITDEANPTEIIKMGVTTNTLQPLVKLIVNEVVTSQYQEKRKKHWRDLGSIDFGVMHDHENSRRFFFYSLILAMYEIFGTKKYTLFNGLLRTCKRPVEGQILTVYEFICHQIEFCEVIRREYVRFIDKVIEQKRRGAEKSLALSQYKESLNNEQQFKLPKDWRIHDGIKYSPAWFPIELICDSADKSMSIRSLIKLSPNPLDYPNKVTTTSEMFCYLASHNRELIILDDFDFSIYEENYPLTKLFIDFMDRQPIDFSLFRINVDDYEEWDYINPKLDKEIRRTRK